MTRLFFLPVDHERTCLVFFFFFSGHYFDFGTGKHKPECRQRNWEPYDFTYDSVPQAILTLFTVQTGEGWPT